MILLRKIIKKHLKFIFLLLSLTSGLLAKSTPLIYLDNELIYHYLDYQINTGKNIPQFALQQPFNISLLQLPDTSDKINQYFLSRLIEFYGVKNTAVGIEHQGFIKKSDSWSYLYRFDFDFHYNSDLISMGNRTRVDRNYKNDPYYAGDLSEASHWIYGRVNDAYLSLNFQRIGIFIGKTDRNWGPIGENSLILSGNPYSYDHIMFNYTGRRMLLTAFFSQLENARGTEYNPDDSTCIFFQKVNRYLSGHRLDISISERFQIGLTEMAIYGGENRNVELAYLNPLTFYYGVQRNDNKGMSGLWALDIMFKPVQRVTLYGQFLIDDIIVNNDPGVNDRERYPDRLGLLTSLRTGDLLFEGLDIDVSFVKIWNRTYQSLRSWENYHYRGLSLGYPIVSCEEFKIKLDYWSLFPFYFGNELIFGKYGNASVTDMFYCIKEEFPIKPVTNNIASIFSMQYFVNEKLNINLRYKYFKDADHYLNRYTDKSKSTFYFGIDYLFSKGIEL